VFDRISDHGRRERSPNARARFLAAFALREIQRYISKAGIFKRWWLDRLSKFANTRGQCSVRHSELSMYLTGAASRITSEYNARLSTLALNGRCHYGNSYLTCIATRLALSRRGISSIAPARDKVRFYARSINADVITFIWKPSDPIKQRTCCSITNTWYSRTREQSCRFEIRRFQLQSVLASTLKFICSRNYARLRRSDALSR